MTAHTLIIRSSDDPDGSWEIEHPGGCYVEVWSVPGHEVSYWDTDCVISGKIESDPDATNEFGVLSPGRYGISYRHDGEGDRYEDWLEIDEEGNRGMTAHTLIITEGSDEPWIIDHPDDCSRATSGSLCSIDREIFAAGLPDRLTLLPSGVYGIEYKAHTGIRLVIRDEISTVLDGLDSKWWKEITRKGRKTGFDWNGEP